MEGERERERKKEREIEREEREIPRDLRNKQLKLLRRF